MFLVAPTGNGLRLRVFPVATLLVVLVNVGVAVWALPESARARQERRTTTLALQAPAPAGPARLAAVRRAALGARLAAADARDPVRVCGYAAGDPAWRAAGALFVHAGWMHLAANVLLLVFVGTHLEQSVGFAPLLGLYLAAGSLALQVDAALGPPAVLVGASAGVSALLGAAFVRFRDRPLRCAWVYFEYLRPRRGAFLLPCPLVAAVWVIAQGLGFAFAARSGAADTAHVAHLTGLGLGAGAALLAMPERHPERPPS